MDRVVVESPYAGDVEANVAYARGCVRNCILRGEAPIASHLLLTQDGILDDDDEHERGLGIKAGHAWIADADYLVVYTDRGVSKGMAAGIAEAHRCGTPVRYRQLSEATSGSKCPRDDS